MATVDGRPSVAVVHSSVPARAAHLDVDNATSYTFWPESGTRSIYGPGLYTVCAYFTIDNNTASFVGLKLWLEAAPDSGGSPGAWSNVDPGGSDAYVLPLIIKNDDRVVFFQFHYMKQTAAREYLRIQMTASSSASTIRVNPSSSPVIASYVRVFKTPVW